MWSGQKTWFNFCWIFLIWMKHASMKDVNYHRIASIWKLAFANLPISMTCKYEMQRDRPIWLHFKKKKTIQSIKSKRSCKNIDIFEPKVIFYSKQTHCQPFSNNSFNYICDVSKMPYSQYCQRISKFYLMNHVRSTGNLFHLTWAHMKCNFRIRRIIVITQQSSPHTENERLIHL